MFKDWEGMMDWPLNKEWKCEICGSRSLIWGLPHATCRCTTCHVQYRMRNEKDDVVDTPICRLKPEYHTAFGKLYLEKRKPIDEITKEEWDEVFKEKEHATNTR